MSEAEAQHTSLVAAPDTTAEIQCACQNAYSHEVLNRHKAAPIVVNPLLSNFSPLKNSSHIATGSQCTMVATQRQPPLAQNAQVHEMPKTVQSTKKRGSRKASEAPGATPTLDMSHPAGTWYTMKTIRGRIACRVQCSDGTIDAPFRGGESIAARQTASSMKLGKTNERARSPTDFVSGGASLRRRNPVRMPKARTLR